MKRIFSILAAASLLLVCASANAQENSSEPIYGPFQTGGANSNWFVSVGGGINWVSGASYGVSESGKVTPSLNVSFGKWVTPTFGARLGYQGLKSSANEQKFGCNYIHGDLLWNISNQFWGYKADRLYNCIPYINAGLFFGRGTEFGGGAGVLNNFRINDRFVIFADLRASAVRAQQVYGGDGAVCVVDLSVGLTVNLGKKLIFEKSEAADNGALADAQKALADAKKAISDAQKVADDASKAAADAQKEADAAKGEAAAANAAAKDAEDKLNNLKNKPQDVITNVVNHLVAGPLTVYFELGKTTLSTMEGQHLKYYLDNLLKGDGKDDVKFILTGSADKGTGTAEINAALCEQRVATVKKVLVENYGVSEDNIVVNEAVSSEDTEHPEFGRAVIIEH